MVPHVFRMKRFRDTSMLLSLQVNTHYHFITVSGVKGHIMNVHLTLSWHNLLECFNPTLAISFEQLQLFIEYI